MLTDGHWDDRSIDAHNETYKWDEKRYAEELKMAKRWWYRTLEVDGNINGRSRNIAEDKCSVEENIKDMENDRVAEASCSEERKKDKSEPCFNIRIFIRIS